MALFDLLAILLISLFPYLHLPGDRGGLCFPYIKPITVSTEFGPRNTSASAYTCFLFSTHECRRLISVLL